MKGFHTLFVLPRVETGLQEAGDFANVGSHGAIERDRTCKGERIKEREGGGLKMVMKVRCVFCWLCMVYFRDDFTPALETRSRGAPSARGEPQVRGTLWSATCRNTTLFLAVSAMHSLYIVIRS